jgi:integrase/recombinase XerD
MFKAPKLVNWRILEKDVVDEIIFRTMNARNRLMLELMARAGMRIGEVLKLMPGDLDGQRIHIREPKSGREGEIVYLPKKLVDRLHQYVLKRKTEPSQRIFPITYVAAWYIVQKAGELVGIKLSPHDLRRHAATYASRSGTPIEIISKVILRHVDLSTTQLYLGKVSDQEAMRWIENLHG